jgi:phage tail-like protein
LSCRLTCGISDRRIQSRFLLMAEYYPPAAFHFRVEFLDIDTVDNDVLFQSVSGLTATIETENVKEGGENRFTHALPVRTQYSDLVLKRGVLTDSGVIAWCRDALEAFAFQPITVLVHLLDAAHEPLITWNVVHAWPKKWSTSDLNSEQNALLIETLELSYAFFTVSHSAPA